MRALLKNAYKQLSAVQPIVFFMVLFFMQNGFAQNTISGTVRYSDNNDLVTDGIVKAYTLDGIQVSQTNIQLDGTYLLTGLPCIELDVIGFPNIPPSENNFEPTWYPDQIDPQSATNIYSCSTSTSRDIHVERIGGGGNVPLGNITLSGRVFLNSGPINDAVVYAETDNHFRYFGVSLGDGSYEIPGLLEGNLTITVYRIGCTSFSQNIQIFGDKTINFNLNKSVKTQLNEFPKILNLKQNYPNPFNPTTTIKFDLPEGNGGFASLSIYDILGREVAKLVNQQLKPGSYEFEFDGANLPSGTYFYRLEYAGLTQIKRMILIK